MNSSVTRRTFLKGSAATAALAATGAGVCSLGAWQAEAAHAEGSYERKEGASLCNGCSSKCGLVATTLGGQLFTLRGSDVHPYAKGTICGRGHGVAQIAYSDERLTQPMRRAADGSFEAIDWDTAFSEIGAKVKDILAKNGPEALAIVQDPRPSGKEYSKRFINALGSANIYTHGAACNSSKEAGFAQTIGTGNFSVDFGNSKMVVFIGRSYGDGIRPSSVQSLAAAADKGTRIVIVDPRLNNSGIFATDWVSIKPGTDLAFLLGICNVLIEEDLYDHEFVEQNAVGFEEFAAQAKEYTPAWAEQQCGVPAATIEEIARALAKAAPAAAVEASWRAAFGCAHQNSFDTARAVTAVNALLGSWGAKGGALLTSSPKAGDIDKQKFPSAPKPEAKRVGDKEYRHGLEPGRAAGGARRRYEGRVLLQLQRRAGLRPAEGVARGVGEDRSRGHHRRADVRDGARVRLRAARVHLPRAHGAPRVHRRQETLRGHAHAGARAHPPRDEAVR